MRAATAPDVSALDSYRTEWRSLSEHPYNVLLEGAATATDAALHLLQPHLRQPIVWQRPHAPLDLSGVEARALVLRDAAALSGDDQRRLLAWIDHTGSRTQIISTTERPLFALVAEGLFDAALYYRLNVMLLRVGSPNRLGSPVNDAEGVHRRIDNPSTIDSALA
jgi:Sigma-54 interaction domain